MKEGYRLVNESKNYVSKRHIEDIRVKRTLCGESSKNFRFSASNFVNCSKCRVKFERLLS